MSVQDFFDEYVVIVINLVPYYFSRGLVEDSTDSMSQTVTQNDNPIFQPIIENGGRDFSVSIKFPKSDLASWQNVFREWAKLSLAYSSSNFIPSWLSTCSYFGLKSHIPICYITNFGESIPSPTDYSVISLTFTSVNYGVNNQAGSLGVVINEVELPV